MDISRKIIDRSGDIESFNRVLLKFADEFARIGWAEPEEVNNAIDAGDYKTTSMLMHLLNEALLEGDQGCRFIIEGDDLVLIRLDS